jgi:hypothetical protein
MRGLGLASHVTCERFTCKSDFAQQTTKHLKKENQQHDSSQQAFHKTVKKTRNAKARLMTATISQQDLKQRVHMFQLNKTRNVSTSISASNSSPMRAKLGHCTRTAMGATVSCHGMTDVKRGKTNAVRQNEQTKKARTSQNKDDHSQAAHERSQTCLQQPQWPKQGAGFAV